MGKHIERMLVARRDQFQNSQFGRAKPGCATGKLFEHFQHASPKLRQDAQIPAQQIEPRVWRRCPVGAPSKASDLEMMVVDRNAQELRFGETRRFRLAERGIHVPQNDPQGFRLRAEIIQQPDQYQLGIRLRFHPEFDRFATFASLDQPEIFIPNFCRRCGGTESSQCKSGPCVVLASKNAASSASERGAPQTIRTSMAMARSARPADTTPPALEESAVRIRRVTARHVQPACGRA